MQLWGGIECSVNRIGDDYYDQVARGGHADRLADLDLCADLGLQTLRYPVLWERVAPQGLAQADWRWTDERLHRLRALGITPIAGLVHHGGGPHPLHLEHPGFAPGLAEYARAVAKRYPWVTQFTPVNEPMTTARFSGLYGHWYPHGRDPQTFARILLNQCRATVLAMQAIREVTPQAQLIQTEDIGRTHSTPRLAYQAEFENHRRWLSLDLLCGRVRPGHPMHRYLRSLGVAESELDWFRANPCPPDLIGIDYYVTSERFLDDRLENYPPWMHGSNGQNAYADIEAVRVCADGPKGQGAMLLEAWERYGLPLAGTETHLGCTSDEQMRWLWDVWQDTENAVRAGADVRAVTTWALFGMYDWNSLLTRCEGYYEAGAFDVSSGVPVATPLAGLIKTLAARRTPRHAALRSPGWWQRADRIIYPPFVRHARPVPPRELAAV